MSSEVMVYYDDEAIYFEHKGKDSGIVRFTFEQIEGLKRVEEQEQSTPCLSSTILATITQEARMSGGYSRHLARVRGEPAAWL
jgi:hypothetical protein